MTSKTPFGSLFIRLSMTVSSTLAHASNMALCRSEAEEYVVPFLNVFCRVSPQGGRQSILVDFIDFLTGSFGFLQDLIWEEAEITVRKSKKSKSKHC